MKSRHLKVTSFYLCWQEERLQKHIWHFCFSVVGHLKQTKWFFRSLKIEARFKFLKQTFHNFNAIIQMQDQMSTICNTIIHIGNSKDDRGHKNLHKHMGLQNKNEDKNHYIKHTTLWWKASWSVIFICYYETCIRGSPIWICKYQTRLILTVFDLGSLSLTVHHTKHNCTQYCCSNF